MSQIEKLDKGISGISLDERPTTPTMENIYKDRMASLLRAFLMAKYTKNDNTPCQIEEGLYVGSIGAAYNKDQLKTLNITHILCVANAIETPYPEDFNYKRIEVRDSTDVQLDEHFEDCFAFIDQAKASGGAVLVHCFAGRSRSVTVVVAYLMKTHKMGLSQALELVKSRRPEALPNPGFMLQLERFGQRLGVNDSKA